MSKPVRSIRLERRSSKSLDTLSGAAGEIFYDRDNGTLRVYTDNSGDKILFASRTWVNQNTFSGDYTDLTNKPSAFANLDFIGCQFGTTINEFSTDGTFADNSDSAVPTEAAVKTYVDTAIGSADGTLDGLTDVVLTSPTSNQVLRYDGANWINDTVQGFQDTNTEYSVTTAIATGGAYVQLVGSDASVDFIKLEEGSNVSIIRTDPSTIQISAAVGSLALEELSNVSTLTPSTGQVLKWDGTQWAPAVDATLGGAGLDAETLNGQAGTYYLDYNNFTNTPTIPADLTDLGIVDGSIGQVLTTDGAGNFSFTTVSGGGGAVALSELTDIDLTGITDGSILKYNNISGLWEIGTDQTGAGSAYDQDLNTTSSVVFNSVSSSTFINSGIGAPVITSATNITLTAPDGIILNGPTIEPTSTLSGATGTVNHDISTNLIFIHNSLNSDFTANFVNVPDTTNNAISIVLVLNQGVSAFLPTAVQIDGVPAGVVWQGGVVPVATVNSVDVLSYTIIGSAVLGSAVSYI